jgi:hypothetical protein
MAMVSWLSWKWLLLLHPFNDFLLRWMSDMAGVGT